MEKGHLRIYFGYCAGVGKTYNMLKDAHSELKKGVDIVIGYLEPHDRIDTINKAKGLEQVPLKKIEYKGMELFELNVDEVIKRNPKICLVDELAHTNAIGSKSKKRYIDIVELLNNGIDVWTTVNIQHIEGLHDLIGENTLIDIKETIPDEILDDADEIKLIDVEPNLLIERMLDGKIYNKKQATYALNNFFKEDNLTFLREILMRRTADKIEKKSNNIKKHINILVLISPSPSSFKNVYVASRMAEAYHTSFVALYVEKNFELDENNAASLKKHMQLVRDLGGEILVKYSDDVISAITNYAKITGVTDLIMGKNWKRIKNKKSLEDKIIEQLPNVQVLIVPNSNNSTHKYNKLKNSFRSFLNKIKYKEKYKNLNTLVDIYTSISTNLYNYENRLEAITDILSNALERSVALISDKIEALSINNNDLYFFKEENDLAIAKWVCTNKKIAGRGSDTLNSNKAIYYPLKINNLTLAISCVNSKLKVCEKMLINQLLPFLNVIYQKNND